MDPRGTLVDLGLPPGGPASSPTGLIGAGLSAGWRWLWQSWENRDLEPKVMTSIPASTASPKVGGPAWGPGRLCSPDAPEPRLPLP